MVYCDTIRSTDGILTTVTLADAVFLIILAVEMELQVIHNLTRLLGQAVFLHQRHHGQFHRSQSSRQFQHDTSFTTFQCFFCISSTHNAKEHTVHTDRCFNNIRSIAFVQFRIEILDTLATELLVLAQVKVRTAVNTFHFLESKRHQEFDVCSCVGIMCQFVVVMETVMIITET